MALDEALANIDMQERAASAQRKVWQGKVGKLGPRSRTPRGRRRLPRRGEGAPRAARGVAWEEPGGGGGGGGGGDLAEASRRGESEAAFWRVEPGPAEERGEGREGLSARVLQEAEPRTSKNSIQ